MRASAIQAEGKALTHALRVIPQGRVGDFHVIFLSGFAATVRARLVSVVFALFEMGGELIEAEGIEHAVFRDRSLARHHHAPRDIVDLVRRMGVRIDAEHTTQLKATLAPAPVQIEPPRVGIDLDGDALFGAGCKNLLHVHFVAGASQQLPPGDVAENGGVRVGDGFEDAFGLLGLAHAKLTVDAGNDHVEAVENLVGIIKRAVRQNVGLDAFEDAESAAEVFVEFVDLLLLRQHFGGLQASRIMRGLRVLRQAEIGIAAVFGGLRHVFKCVPAVRFRRMGMQDAANIFVRDQFGQFTIEREHHFLTGFAQLGRNERQAQRVVDVFLAFAGDNAIAFSETVAVENEAFVFGDGLQGFDVLIRAGCKEECGAIALVIGHMDGQAVTCSKCVILAFELRIDGNQRHCADDFAAAAEFTGGRDACEMWMRALEFGHRIADRRSGAMEMPTLRAAAHLDPLQYLGLKGRTESFGGCEAIRFGGLFELCEGFDPELFVELLDAVGLETGDAQHLQHALRRLRARRFKTGVVPCLMKLRDDRGERFADAGDFREALVFNELVERDCAEGEVFGSAVIGPGAIRVSAFQRDVVADLPEKLGDF
jgi:hypothetical protein